MILVDVLRELLNHNLGESAEYIHQVCQTYFRAPDRTWASATAWAARTTLSPVSAIASRAAAYRTR